MAMRNLEVIVTVVDKASKQLKDVEKNVKSAGKAAAGANVDFTKFTRTIFAGAATLALLTKSVNSLFNSLEAGGMYDRLSNQYERLFGDKGILFSSISKFTDASIDKEEALQAAVSLGNLGISKSSEDVAHYLALAGAAARRAGKDTSEGVKEVTEFMKDGEIAHLQNLDLVKKTDVGFRLLNMVMSKYGGAIGGVIAPQVRMAAGIAFLNKVVGPFLKGYQDGADVIKEFRSNLTILKDNIGRLLITALSPMVKALSVITEKAVDFIDKLRKNNKGILELIKYSITASVVLGTLATSLLVLRSAVMALNSLGVGIPRLNAGIILMGGLFLGLTRQVKPLSDKFELFGKFVTAIIQLFTTFDEKTGKSKIGANLKRQLEQAGIYQFALFLTKIALITKTVMTDIVDSFTWMSKKFDNILSFMGFSFQSVVGKTFSGVWNNFWVNESLSPVQKTFRAIKVIFAGLAAWWLGKKLFGGLNSILGKIPVIGKLFGGGGRGPSGTSTDPLYVTQVGGLIAGAQGILGTVLGSTAGKTAGGLLVKLISPIKTFIASNLAGLSMMFDSMVSAVVTGFSTLFAVAGPIAVPLVEAIIAGVYAWKIGEMLNKWFSDWLGGHSITGGIGGLIYNLSHHGTIFDETTNNKMGKSSAATSDKTLLGMSNKTEKSAAGISSVPNISNSNNMSQVNPLSSASIPSSYNQQLGALDQIGQTMMDIHNSNKDTYRQAVQGALDNGMTTTDVLGAQQFNDDVLGALGQNNTYLKNISDHFRNKSSQINPNVKHAMAFSPK